MYMGYEGCELVVAFRFASIWQESRRGHADGVGLTGSMGVQFTGTGFCQKQRRIHGLRSCSSGNGMGAPDSTEA